MSGPRTTARPMAAMSMVSGDAPKMCVDQGRGIRRVGRDHAQGVRRQATAQQGGDAVRSPGHILEHADRGARLLVVAGRGAREHPGYSSTVIQRLGRQRATYPSRARTRTPGRVTFTLMLRQPRRAPTGSRGT